MALDRRATVWCARAKKYRLELLGSGTEGESATPSTATGTRIIREPHLDHGTFYDPQSPRLRSGDRLSRARVGVNSGRRVMRPTASSVNL